MAFVAFAVLAAAVARPSDARRAKKAVMKAVQRFLGWKVLMAPRFRTVRLLTSPIMWIPAAIPGSDARCAPIFGLTPLVWCNRAGQAPAGGEEGVPGGSFRTPRRGCHGGPGRSPIGIGRCV
ncbi:hypothetical protein GCM10027028_30080 [Streptomyces sundarbansensis]